MHYVLRKLSGAILTLLAASFIIFVLVEASPGNVARKTLGPFASEGQVQVLYDKLQLGDPLIVRYGRWIGVLTGLRADPLARPELGMNFKDPRGDQYVGNFGFSTMLKVPVADIIGGRLLKSLLLAGIAIAAIIPLSIIIGTIGSLYAGRFLDRVMTLLSTVLGSIPEFASAVILIGIFVVHLEWLPGTSPMQPNGTWPIYAQLILPALVLTLYVSAYVSRFVRSAMIDVMAMPYVRTAILKGMPYHRVVMAHVFRNAMIAPFTVILLQINWLISGVVVTEVVFAYPGIGRLLLEAALFGDIAIIEAAALIAVCVAVTTQLVGDVGYMLLNPRIRFK